MFSELTNFRFISVTAVHVIFTIHTMETLSESIYGEEEGSELDELSETVHMVLFLVMVLFLAQVSAWSRSATRSRSSGGSGRRRRLISYPDLLWGMWRIFPGGPSR